MKINKKYGLILLLNLGLCTQSNPMELSPTTKLILGNEIETTWSKLEKKHQKNNNMKTITRNLNTMIENSMKITQDIISNQNQDLQLLLDGNDSTNQCHLNALLIVMGLNNQLQNIDQKELYKYMVLNTLRPYSAVLDHGKKLDTQNLWLEKLGVEEEDRTIIAEEILSKDIPASTKGYYLAQYDLANHIKRKLSETRRELLKNLLKNLKLNSEIISCNHDGLNVIPKVIGMDIMIQIMKKLGDKAPIMILRCKNINDKSLSLGLITVQKEQLNIELISKNQAQKLAQGDSKTLPVIVIDSWTHNNDQMQQLIKKNGIEQILRTICAEWMGTYQPNGVSTVKKHQNYKQLYTQYKKQAKKMGITYNEDSKEGTSIAIGHMYPDTLEHALRMETL